MVDLGVDALRWVPSDGRRHESYSLRIVVSHGAFNRFVLRQDDEAAAVRVELWVHRARRLLPAAESQANVHAIMHAVDAKGMSDRVTNESFRRDAFK